MAQLINLMRNAAMSKRTLLDELQRGGVLDPDLVIEEELTRIEEEAKTIDPEPVIEQDDAEVKPASLAGLDDSTL